MALGAGFLEGIGLGNNSKAAIIRLGLLEMRRFIQARPARLSSARPRATLVCRPAGSRHLELASPYPSEHGAFSCLPQAARPREQSEHL